MHRLELLQVFNAAHAAGCNQANIRQLLQLFQHIHVGAGQHAVAADIRIDNRLDANGQEKLCKRQYFFVTAVYPAARRDDIPFGINGYSQGRTIFLSHCRNKGFILDGFGTNNDAVYANLQIALNRFFAANAAAYFYGYIYGIANASNDFCIAAAAGKRAVQIDNMQKQRPFIAPFDSGFYRIGKIRRTIFFYALAQADCMSVLYIYRRKYNH